ncbi:MAG: tRNA-intron lyase [Nanoarchaeota archaeon]
MPKEKIQINFNKQVFSSNSSEAFSLYDKSCFGEPDENKDKINYGFSEAIYLVEKNKAEAIKDKKFINKEDLMKKISRMDKKIYLKYAVYKDLRTKGYIVKTALKFGADFRIYPKGKRPGETHAKWIVFAEHETKKTSWQEFSAKNRVAHSTKKNLLLGIVDEEQDVTYYEVSWIKP